MYLLGAIAVNILFLGIILFCLLNPSKRSLITIGIAIAGYSNAIDQYWGRVTLVGLEEYTQLTTLDLIFLIFLVLKINKAKLKKHTLLISIIIPFIPALNLIYNQNTIKDIYVFFVYSWEYIRVIIFFLAFVALINNDKFSRPSRKIDILYFWSTLILFFTLCLFMFLTSENKRLNLPHLNQNILANYLAILILSCIWIKALSSKREYLIFVALLSITIIMTASRTGLGCLLILLIISSLHNDKPAKATIKILLATIAIALIFTLNERASEAILNITDITNIDTIRSRISIWTANLEYLGSRLYWGAGAGQQYLDNDYPRILGSLLGYRYVFVTAHNDFLQSIMHLGLTFSIPFFFLILTVIKRSGPWFTFLLIFQFTMNSNIETPRYGMLLGMLLAICWKYRNTKFGRLAQND